MRTFETEKRLRRVASALCVSLALAALGTAALAARRRGPQEAAMPGPLSLAHADVPGASDCLACHTPDRKAAPAKCLACHGEIAREVSAGTGFHGDKGDGCGVCHREHRGREAALLPLDVEDFDHAETGFVLRGAHRRVKDCGLCHRPAISFPRGTTRSYILLDSGCPACHASPHPGRQDDCLACHDQNSWTIDRLARRAGP